jgi:carbonic anhydrase
MITGNTIIKAIKKENQVNTIMKLENGDLLVTQNSGNQFTIKKEDELFQAFIVFSAIKNGF